MKKALTLLLLAIILNGTAMAAPKTINGYTFNDNSAILTNPWMPMAEGTAWTLLGISGAITGISTTTEAVDVETVYGVQCLKVKFVDDPTTGAFFFRWFAQDTIGNVHFFKKTETDDDVFMINSDDDIPHIIMPANPAIGDSWEAWTFDGHNTRTLTVESLDGTIGQYSGCLVISEDSIDNSTDEYYQYGVGEVGVSEPDMGTAIRSQTIVKTLNMTSVINLLLH